jgi:hypothetical protein
MSRESKVNESKKDDTKSLFGSVKLSPINSFKVIRYKMVIDKDNKK